MKPHLRKTSYELALGVNDLSDDSLVMVLAKNRNHYVTCGLILSMYRAR